MTRTMLDQPGVVRKASAEAARRMASRPADRPQVIARVSERPEHSLVASALRLGAILLMLPLGLALATGGAWQSVLWLGAALVVAGLWTVYEDVSERRTVEMVGVEQVGVEMVGVENVGAERATAERAEAPDYRTQPQPPVNRLLN